MRKTAKLPQGQVNGECQQDGTISHMKKGGKEVDGNPGAYKSSLGGQWRSERGIVRGRQKAKVSQGRSSRRERAQDGEAVHRAAVAEESEATLQQYGTGRAGIFAPPVPAAHLLPRGRETVHQQLRGGARGDRAEP